MGFDQVLDYVWVGKGGDVVEGVVFGCGDFVQDVLYDFV